MCARAREAARFYLDFGPFRRLAGQLAAVSSGQMPGLGRRGQASSAKCKPSETTTPANKTRAPKERARRSELGPAHLLRSRAGQNQLEHALIRRPSTHLHRAALLVCANLRHDTTRQSVNQFAGKSKRIVQTDLLLVRARGPISAVVVQWVLRVFCCRQLGTKLKPR